MSYSAATLSIRILRWPLGSENFTFTLIEQPLMERKLMKMLLFSKILAYLFTVCTKKTFSEK